VFEPFFKILFLNLENSSLYDCSLLYLLFTTILPVFSVPLCTHRHTRTCKHAHSHVILSINTCINTCACTCPAYDKAHVHVPKCQQRLCTYTCTVYYNIHKCTLTHVHVHKYTYSDMLCMH